MFGGYGFLEPCNFLFQTVFNFFMDSTERILCHVKIIIKFVIIGLKIFTQNFEFSSCFTGTPKRMHAKLS